MDSLPAMEMDVEFAPWDGRRVPVTLIGGYLGAGKTTVVNRVLARTDRPIAVLVNDVGEIAIDHRLIARRHTDAIELTDGCICCSLSEGLANAFDRIRARPTPPDHLLIELSGVADPTQVVPWARSTGFRLDAVIVLADAEHVVERLDDPRVGPLVRRQIGAADLILLTRTDLVDEATLDEARARVDDEAGDCPVLVSADPEVVAGLLDTATRRPGGVATTPPPTLFDRHRASTVPLPDPVSFDDLHDLVTDLDPDVVRAKGVARTEDGSRLLVQVVGRRREITALPGAEDQPPTDLVVISLG